MADVQPSYFLKNILFYFVLNSLGKGRGFILSKKPQIIDDQMKNRKQA